ncbi:hypothetical protein RRG08_015025 [Elysia crispata]|uniref:Uncharacterized protein n=1 Tax=Elysia crispata TaxID=231223 RepID=A0AAE1DG00_9GAST|nr:hypothetical protein RRG08_015025 [Elysia crispata]
MFAFPIVKRLTQGDDGGGPIANGPDRSRHTVPAFVLTLPKQPQTVITSQPHVSIGATIFTDSLNRALASQLPVPVKSRVAVRRSNIVSIHLTLIRFFASFLCGLDVHYIIFGAACMVWMFTTSSLDQPVWFGCSLHHLWSSLYGLDVHYIIFGAACMVWMFTTSSLDQPVWFGCSLHHLWTSLYHLDVHYIIFGAACMVWMFTTSSLDQPVWFGCSLHHLWSSLYGLDVHYIIFGAACMV